MRRKDLCYQPPLLLLPQLIVVQAPERAGNVPLATSTLIRRPNGDFMSTYFTVKKLLMITNDRANPNKSIYGVACLKRRYLFKALNGFISHIPN